MFNINSVLLLTIYQKRDLMLPLCDAKKKKRKEKKKATEAYG